MSSISVYLDTNCINARGKDQFLNKLEDLYEQEKIIIEKTDTLDTELQEGHSLGLKKSMNYIESYGPAVWDHSRWGHAIFSDKLDEERLDKVLSILWGKKPRSNYTKQELRDAMHISTTARYGGTFFVTNENRLLAKSNEIEKIYGVKIRTPQKCLLEVQRRLKVLENY